MSCSDSERIRTLPEVTSLVVDDVAISRTLASHTSNPLHPNVYAVSFSSLTLLYYFSRPARISYLVYHCNFITDQQGREDMIHDDMTTGLRSKQPALPPCIRYRFISQCLLFLVFLRDDCGRLSRRRGYPRAADLLVKLPVGSWQFSVVRPVALHRSITKFYAQSLLRNEYTT